MPDGPTKFPALTESGAMRFFSSYGKKIHNPAGIHYWTGRAKIEASINATIGSARGRQRTVFPEGDNTPITFYLPYIKDFFRGLGTEEIFPYAPEAGLPDFREAWKRWILRKAGEEAERLGGQLHLPVVTPGITSAIAICARLFVDPDSFLIVPDKRWENYDNVFLRNVGTRIEEFPLLKGQTFNLGGLRNAVHRVWKQQENAVVLLNFPNNPTGYCPSRAEAQDIADLFHHLAEETDKGLVLLLDDAYESFVYDDQAAKGSLFYQTQACKNLLPVKLDGISKELLWYGGRVGAITLACPGEWFRDVDRHAVAEELDNKFKGIIRNTVSNCSTVAQTIATRALQNIDHVVRERQLAIEELNRRHLSIKAALTELGGTVLTADPFHGGFFCFININPASGLKATTLCDHLLRRYKIGTVPMEQGHLNGIRIAFCSVEAEDIPGLFRNLREAVADLT